MTSYRTGTSTGWSLSTFTCDMLVAQFLVEKTYGPVNTLDAAQIQHISDPQLISKTHHGRYLL